jgi:predicted nucleotidyltransferase
MIFYFYLLLPTNKMDVSVISEGLGVPVENFLLITVYGSRLAETHSANSDWDFLIVIRDYSDIPIESYHHKCIELPNMDINLYERRHYMKALEQNDIIAVESVFIEERFVLLRNEVFAYELDRNTLRKSISTCSNKAAGYAWIMWRQGDIIKAKKNIIHSLRFSLYGTQLVTTGSITDYKCANVFLRSILDDPETNWSILSAHWIKDICKGHHKKFIELCQ